MNLVEQVRLLQKSSVGSKVKQRLEEFESFQHKSEKEWFSELCFCILTANSRAKTALAIQSELGPEGFCNACSKDVKECIIKNKHRFHNNKTDFIMQARKHLDIKQKIHQLLRAEGETQAREWLVKNVKGLGYKEASHFLRNIGCKSLSILDRHILNLMKENGLISERPKSLTRNSYLETEKKFKALAEELNMSAAELDLYMWYMKTGEVLK